MTRLNDYTDAKTYAAAIFMTAVPAGGLRVIKNQILRYYTNLTKEANRILFSSDA
ncbi:MAG: hypothetical protein N4A49_15165 [Marinifilaceae bacterium]|nr:hypothetical protein [Marinifilaceae bacterium]